MLFVLGLALALVPTLASASEESCYDAGYEDGLSNPFSSSNYEACGNEAGDNAGSYYAGFMDGCVDAENTIEVCESEADAGTGGPY